VPLILRTMVRRNMEREGGGEGRARSLKWTLAEWSAIYLMSSVKQCRQFLCHYSSISYICPCNLMLLTRFFDILVEETARKKRSS